MVIYNQWLAYITPTSTILDQLAFYKKAHKDDRTYQFWQEGCHPEWIQNEEMMRQKIEYIHHNPVKRGYVDKVEHWRYSSVVSSYAFPRRAWEREEVLDDDN